MSCQATKDYIECLEAENAKLREELEDAPKCETCVAMDDCYECLRADSSQKERKRLDYENEKLWELVWDMTAVIWAYDECTSDDCPPALPLFEDRLRELGIEVGA